MYINILVSDLRYDGATVYVSSTFDRDAVNPAEYSRCSPPKDRLWGGATGPYLVHCKSTLVGRYLIIYKDGLPLELCEVEVYSEQGNQRTNRYREYNCNEM